MSFLQRTLILAVVVSLVGAWDPWSYFDNSEGENHMHVNEKGNESLCPTLFSLMEDLSVDNTFNCQPLPSHVKGKIPEFCNFAAVDTVRGCRRENNVTECLSGALGVSQKNNVYLLINRGFILLQAVKNNEPYSDCMCHGYLENYAALWSVWSLACNKD